MKIYRFNIKLEDKLNPVFFLKSLNSAFIFSIILILFEGLPFFFISMDEAMVRNRQVLPQTNKD